MVCVRKRLLRLLLTDDDTINREANEMGNTNAFVRNHMKQTPRIALSEPRAALALVSIEYRIES